jgi:hypothetical protein
MADPNTMTGFLAPQWDQGLNPIDFGQMLATKPEAAAEVFAKLGAPPPVQGMGFTEWLSGVGKSLGSMMTPTGPPLIRPGSAFDRPPASAPRPPTTLANLPDQPSATMPLPPPPQAMSQMPGAPLDIRSPAQQAMDAGAPTVPGAASNPAASSPLAGLSGLTAPKDPPLQKVSSPPPPRHGAMPRNDIAALVAQMAGRDPDTALRLQQALGGGR